MQSGKRAYALRFLGVLALGLIAIPTFGQIPAGTIQGVATDASGATVPNATVTVRNSDTDLMRTVTTGDDGEYRVPALPTGHYTIKIEKTGFGPETREGLTLEVTETAVVNFTLQVGASTSQVVVTTEAPMVNTTEGVLGGLVNAQQIVELPLNGRNYISLSLLQAGITKHQSEGGSEGEAGAFFTSDGATPRSNYFTIDGANVGNYEGGNSASLGGTTLGLDGIQEFKMITNSPGAEYGMSMGSQMVMVSKGGTNHFHGDAFDYLRNAALDAKNYFDTPLAANDFERLPPFRRNNFGGAFGGPIRKDKTFVWAVYEGLRQNLGVTAISTVLPSSCYSGATLLLTNNPCAVTATNPAGNVAPVVQKLAQLWPAPNVGANRFSFSTANPTSDDYGQIRVDQSISASDTFFVRYTRDNSNLSTAGVKLCGGCAFPQFRQGKVGVDQFTTLSESHIFSPTLLNTVRFSFSRSVDELSDVYPEGLASLTGPGLSLFPGLPTGTISVGGLSPFGQSSTSPTHHVQNVYASSDDLYYTKGKHGLKFGTLINRYNQAFTQSFLPNGNTTWSNVNNFLNGIYKYYEAAEPGANETGFFVFNTFGFYAQDDWRVKPRLTLNLGLRYEFKTQPNDTSDYQYALRNPLTDTAATQGPPFRNPSLYDLAPRLGFAWDIFGNGMTAIRGGFGEYYDLANYGQVLVRDEQALPPISGESQHFNTKPAQVLTLPLTFSPGDTGTSLHIGNYHAGQPRDLQGNLTVEQKLPLGMGLSVSYVGLRSMSLWTVTEGNPVPPTSITNGVEFWGSPAITAGCESTVQAVGGPPPNPFPCRTNPFFGTMNYLTTGGDGWYNGLQVTVNKQLSRGLQFQGAYTYSKNLDTTSTITYTNDCDSPGIAVGFDPDLKHDRAPACDDVRNVLHFNLLYHFPNIKSDNAVLAKIANGWWMGNIVSIQGGYPFSVTEAEQRSQSGLLGGDQGDYPDKGTTTTTVSLPNPNNPAQNINVTFVPYNKNKVITGNPNDWVNVDMFQLEPVGYLGNAGRSTLRGPGQGAWDFSLVKDTKVRALGEDGMVEFRTEIFNILNRANFDVPSNTVIFPGTLSDVGPYTEAPSNVSITDTVTTSRQIQFALKLIF
ncbi:MAG: TonB-dependent receptor [Candidatus Acidiferrales bacterium]